MPLPDITWLMKQQHSLEHPFKVVLVPFIEIAFDDYNDGYLFLEDCQSRWSYDWNVVWTSYNLWLNLSLNHAIEPTFEPPSEIEHRLN